MFHYIIKMKHRNLHVLDVLLKCHKYVIMYKIGAEAQTNPRNFLEVIGDVCQAHTDLEPLEHVLWTWQHELTASGMDEGAAVASKDIYDRFLSIVTSDYGDLPEKHCKVPDLDTFNSFLEETRAVFNAAPLMNFEANASVQKTFTPTSKLAN